MADLGLQREQLALAAREAEQQAELDALAEQFREYSTLAAQEVAKAKQHYVKFPAVGGVQVLPTSSLRLCFTDECTGSPHFHVPLDASTGPCASSLLAPAAPRPRSVDVFAVPPMGVEIHCVIFRTHWHLAQAHSLHNCFVRKEQAALNPHTLLVVGRRLPLARTPGA